MIRRGVERGVHGPEPIPFRQAEPGDRVEHVFRPVADGRHPRHGAAWLIAHRELRPRVGSRRCGPAARQRCRRCPRSRQDRPAVGRGAAAPPGRPGTRRSRRRSRRRRRPCRAQPRAGPAAPAGGRARSASRAAAAYSAFLAGSESDSPKPHPHAASAISIPRRSSLSPSSSIEKPRSRYGCASSRVGSWRIRPGQRVGMDRSSPHRRAMALRSAG